MWFAVADGGDEEIAESRDKRANTFKVTRLCKIHLRPRKWLEYLGTRPSLYGYAPWFA